MNVLYAILLLGGLAGAALIYLVLFNELSESQLVTYTPLFLSRGVRPVRIRLAAAAAPSRGRPGKNTQ
ncbi:hypothetical protein SGFS_104480 [Streptomyces graminofaciens]|uniref:Secreted protein n=1 Tax=Streptomyces graminofaciens TaxID=68212 RepID=A0ABM7FR96_9ACTN|nr:hypothetical protein SGFS_104480 [Streptomyces graminofaciens]